jgi:hypothetical protein
MTDIHMAPSGESYRDWQAVFYDAQPLAWTAFNTGVHLRRANANTQPESFPPHRDPEDRH